MRLTYLSVDSLGEGIGASQVLAYVERMQKRGADVTLYSFEKSTPDARTAARLVKAGVEWRPQPFGKRGTRGGLGRIARGAMHIRNAELVHARSDLAGASALLGRPDRWVWDARSLYVDQKIELGEVARGSPQESVLRKVESSCARSCDAAIVLTRASIEVLAERYGHDVLAKITVIPTCVDLERFPLTPMTNDHLRLLLAGTINAYYDVPLMVELAKRVKTRVPSEFHVVAPGATRWDAELAAEADAIMSASPDEMPKLIAQSHVGLCVCRENAGASLKASMPTKIAEFLASGRPLVVNPGLGDASDLLIESDCGVVVEGRSPDALERAVDELLRLTNDPATPDRCRALAQKHFNLEAGVDSLIDVYRGIVGVRGSA